MIAGSFIIASCGGGKENNDENTDSTQVVEKTAKDVCVNENQISLVVHKYPAGDDKTIELEMENFDVLMYTYTYKNDSAAEFKLSNYTEEEFNEELQPGQVDIEVTLYSHNGKLLEPASYPYHGSSDNDFYSYVTIYTNEGNAYFNGVVGTQGDVIIDFIDEDNICGSFNLNVDNPDDASVGTVKLNGTFSILK